MRAILSSDGYVVATLVGSATHLELNTPRDALYVDVADGGAAAVGDFYSESATTFMTPPDEHHKYNTYSGAWVDARSTPELRATKWESLKAQRDSLEFGGFEFERYIYDSDQVSQGRIMGAASAGVDQIWTLADNTTVELSASQLQQLYSALQAHIASVHERGRIARQLILEAETKEQVEAVQL